MDCFLIVTARFRESVLTMLLMNSLGGNCKTIMVRAVRVLNF
jgi:hypothetical protein